jgi:hypothetical protein
MSKSPTKRELRHSENYDQSDQSDQSDQIQVTCTSHAPCLVMSRHVPSERREAKGSCEQMGTNAWIIKSRNDELKQEII